MSDVAPTGPSPEQQAAYSRAYLDAVRAQRGGALDALADLAGRDAVAALDDVLGRLAAAERRAEDNRQRAEAAEARVAALTNTLRAAGVRLPD